MIQKLKSYQITQLRNIPESGMGYQFIEAESGFYSLKKKYLVLNCQMLIDDSSEIINEVKNVFNRGFKTMLFSANEAELKNIRLVENLSNSQIKTFSATRHTGAIHQHIEKANGEEVFTRLSAYEDDFRIDSVNKKLVPGSYTTTYVDYQYCKNNNLDPVERYALPNDEPISWAFYIQPIKSDTLQRGIVEPAYGHNGGGVEVYFANGTANYTYFKKTSY
jgi:hypothetical protein